MAAQIADAGYSFGPFKLFTATRLLLRDGNPVVLPPKAFDTLVVLLERAERVVSKQELLHHLWPDVAVEEESLTQQIFVLRKALGDTPEDHRYIATVARRGYRLVAEVRQLSSPGTLELFDGVPLAPPAPRLHKTRQSVPRRAVLWIGVGFVILLTGAALFWSAIPLSHHPSALKFTQLTSDEGVESFPSLSPDGRWFVYASGPLDYPGESDIYFAAADEGGLNHAVNLTPNSPGRDSEPAFSRDGEYIAFRSDRDGGGIFVMRRTGESVRRITGRGFNPCWSPDGRLIAYSTADTKASPFALGAREPSLWIVNATSGEAWKLADSAYQPSWSPHGSRIAFWGSERGVYTVAQTGGQKALLVGGPSSPPAQFYWNPVWSPDGQYVYYISNAAGTMNVWRVPVDERTGRALGSPEAITTPSTYAAHLTFAGNSSRWAFASVPSTAAIHRVEFDPAAEHVLGTPARISNGVGTWVYPEPSPDGRLLAFHSPEDILISKSDGTEARLVTDDPPSDRLARWSPDGQRIAFYSHRHEAWHIWVVKPDGSGLKQISAGTAGEGFPVWAPDGNRLAANSIGGNAIVFDPDRAWSKRNVTVLPEPDGQTHFVPWSWSSDGTRLAGHRGDDRRGILVLNLGSGRFDLVAADGKQPVWLADNRRVLFASFDKLMLADTVTKRVKELISFPGERIELAAGGGFSISRDNRSIYVSPVHREGNIWLVSAGR